MLEPALIPVFVEELEALCNKYQVSLSGKTRNGGILIRDNAGNTKCKIVRLDDNVGMISCID